MKNQLFRKESLDRISSPEQMHDYMRVTSPKMWMILSAIAALLIGFIVYASTATLESTIDITVLSEAGYISSEVSFSQSDIIKTHMPVRIGEQTGYVDNIFQSQRLGLEISFDSDTTLDDGRYEMRLDDEDGLEEERTGNVAFITVNNGIVSMYDEEGVYEKFFDKDRRFTINGNKGTVTDVSTYDAVKITIVLDDADAVLADGAYAAEIVTESTKPISFLLN